MLKEIENLLRACEADITLILSPDDIRKFEQEVKSQADVNARTNIVEYRTIFIRSANLNDTLQREFKIPLVSQSFEILDFKE